MRGSWGWEGAPDGAEGPGAGREGWAEWRGAAGACSAPPALKLSCPGRHRAQCDISVPITVPLPACAPVLGLGALED